MTPTSKTLLFFGNERLVSGLSRTDAPILTALLAHGYKIKAIISHHSDTKSRSNRPLEVAEIAAQHDIPVFLPHRPVDILDQIAEFKANAAILVAYGRIIPQTVIDLLPYGIINVHPSLLPKYRGPTPIESAILSGDHETGVSIMQLSASMDSGPIYGQTKISLKGSETKFDIYQQLSQKGSQLLLSLLPSILDGSLQPTAQDDTQATYCQLLTKADAQLDPTQLTAVEAERQVRAYLGFPKTKLTVAEYPIIITKAHVSQSPKTPLDVQFKDRLYLSIDTLVAPNGRHMDAQAFINGYLRR